MSRTHLARLVQAAMVDKNFTQGDVERHGGPSKQTLGRLLTHWRGDRSLNPDTIPKLATALQMSERTLGRAAAVDMGLLPLNELADDSLSRLVDALRDSASEDHRDLVVAAASGVWGVLKRRETLARKAEAERAAEEKRLKAKLKREAAAAARAQGKAPTSVAKRRTRGLG